MKETMGSMIMVEMSEAVLRPQAVLQSDRYFAHLEIQKYLGLHFFVFLVCVDPLTQTCLTDESCKCRQ